MRYKKMDEMSPDEIQLAFSLLIPGNIMKYFEKSLYGDFIEVYFKRPYDNTLYSITLLPDDVVEIPDIIKIAGNHLWEYQKFMVARGYSELWLNNFYLS